MSQYRCIAAPGPLSATVTLPGSKSITNRALIAAALADGDSLLTGILLAEDTRLMIDALRALGIAITVDEGECGTGFKPVPRAEVSGCRGYIPAGEAELFCGNAGTVMRFCTALVALGRGRFLLDGNERMRHRPIGGLVDALRALGTGVEYLGEEGYPPIAVHASGLRGGQLSFQRLESSQFVSGLLLAAPYANRDIFIEVGWPTSSEVGDPNPTRFVYPTAKAPGHPLPSATYVKLTAAVMEQFGVATIEQYCGTDPVRPGLPGPVCHSTGWKAGPTRDRLESLSHRFIVEAPQRYRGSTLAIEPDASSATYFLAAPAIAGGWVTVERLGTGSCQGDARFAELLGRMGCRVEQSRTQVTVHGPTAGERLHGIDADLNDMPDTVQTLAVVALFADGPTVIRNVANLRIKETDRLAALNRELTRLGAMVEEHGDGLTVKPPERITPAVIETYQDHRMAMSFALVGLRCRGIVINDPECCGKSFPDFFEHFERLTATVC